MPYHPSNRTKILATVGPAISEKEQLKEMIEAGVNVFRINFSHGIHEDHQKVIDFIHELNEEFHYEVGFLADLPGPKIRTTEVVDDNQILVDGEFVDISTELSPSDKHRISITYPSFPRDVKYGDHILIDDGKIELEVLDSNKKDTVRAKVVHGGQLKSNKGVNLPNTRISMPSITERDKEHLKFILDNNFNWIALSFVRRADDLKELKGIINYHNKNCRIIAKIEKPEALEMIDDIIHASDGIMIARGDLGVEVPIERIPIIQKEIVQKCMIMAKPVIIATQMMESMVYNSTPTRAEVTDVANGVIDGADALMLSAETAVGKYPVRVIRTMKRIISKVESEAHIYNRHLTPAHESPTFLSDAICYNACRLAEDIKAQAIIGMTRSGYTAYMISSYRPKSAIYIFTDMPELPKTLSLIWGVKTYFYDRFESTDTTIQEVQEILKEKDQLKPGDLVVNTGSMPLARRGKTNMLKVSLII